MHFFDTLRLHLQRVAQPDRELPRIEVDAATCRQRMIRALRQLEKHAGADAAEGVVPGLHEDWMGDDRIVLFGQELARRLWGSLGDELGMAEIQGLVLQEIEHRVQRPPHHKMTVMDCEALSRGDDLEEELLGQAKDPRDWSAHPAAYAQAINATRHTPFGIQCTAIGQATLNVADRDTVSWLLHLEVIQARLGVLGRLLSQDSVRGLLTSSPIDVFSRGEWMGEDELPCSHAVMARLVRFGVLVEKSDERKRTVTLHEFYRPLLRELASGQETLFAILIHALLDDERNKSLQSARPDGSGSGAGSHGWPSMDGSGSGDPFYVQRDMAGQSVARQARLVAHELRNALHPVQTTVEDLFQALSEPDPPPKAMEIYRERLDRGLARAFRFVTELLDTAALIRAELGPFDIGPVLRDSVAGLNGDARYVETSLPENLPPVTGVRRRFLLAMSNLLRNALQSVTSGPPRIRVEARLRGGEIHIAVEDNGPGIPKEYRQSVFVDGFTLRKGGSGHGLALVAEVTRELGGQIHCTDSALGGARFLVVLPIMRKG